MHAPHVESPLYPRRQTVRGRPFGATTSRAESPGAHSPARLRAEPSATPPATRETVTREW
jgi:hypothetical protein